MIDILGLLYFVLCHMYVILLVVLLGDSCLAGSWKPFQL